MRGTIGFVDNRRLLSVLVKEVRDREEASISCNVARKTERGVKGRLEEWVSKKIIHPFRANFFEKNGKKYLEKKYHHI
jgi:hypothetical protein